MSSVNIDGHDYKRCMKCGEWTDFEDLMYIPSTRQYDEAEFEEVQKNGTDEEFIAACAAFFGMDVCAACASTDETAYRAPTISLSLK